jgi:HK97 family phage prohead protease/HK97 family phage major capsid protein
MNKLFKVIVPFEAKADSENEVVAISGYASTSDKDRVNDVILPEAWQNGIDDFKSNPIILAFHDHSKPIGRADSVDIDNRGLRISARIKKSAAGQIFNLIKDEILSTFSVGFRVKDADYDADTDIFVIKEAELFEVSVVAVPANAKATFSVSKSCNTEEFEEFKKEFVKNGTQGRKHDDAVDALSYVDIKGEEKLMPKEETKSTTEEKTSEYSMQEVINQVKADLKKEAEERAAREAAQKAEDDRISGLATTAAERLLADAKKEILDNEKGLAEVLDALRGELKEKSDEIAELRASRSSKMSFADTNRDPFTPDQKDTAVLLGKIFGKPTSGSKYFHDLVEKSGMEHWASGADVQWEEEYSTRVQNAMREQLVVESAIQTIPISTPTWNFPVNPEAGTAEWIPTSAFRSTDGSSTGTAVDHEIDDKVLTAYKLATKEYVGYEEEEDSIVALMPIIRDAIARRMALSSDLAVLRGPGTTSPYDPITGLEGLGANTTDITVAGGAAWSTNFDEDDVIDARSNLGIYGLDPSQLILFASHDMYYTIMKLTNFKTLDLYGPGATILTGEVGQITGVRVVVSQQFDNAAITAGTVGTTVGILVRPSNFLIGNLRNILTERDVNIEDQRRILVSSRRFGFTDIIAGEATVNIQIAT